MSILSAAERFASIDRSEIVFDAKQCLHSLDQFSSCEACFEICPVEAIQKGKPPTFDSKSCETCLACLTTCPVGAYSASDAVQALLTCVARCDVKSLEVVCAQHEAADIGAQPESTGIRIKGCLAGLGVGTYLALGAMGLEKIVLRMDACANCSWKSLQETICNQLDQARQLLVPWGKQDILIRVTEIDGEAGQRPLWDADNPPLSRRDLFQMAARQGQVAMARMMSDNSSAGRHSLGRDRVRIISAISRFSEPKEALETTVEANNFTLLSVSEKCNACMACARACPTNALVFNLNDEKTLYSLIFNPPNCIGCELCVHVCAPNAIETQQALTFAQVFGSDENETLSEGELIRCAQCDALFAARLGTKLCPPCEFRKKNPFGSKLPGQRATNNLVKGQKTHDS
jgi:ferredoxin